MIFIFFKALRDSILLTGVLCLPVRIIEILNHEQLSDWDRFQVLGAWAFFFLLFLAQHSSERREERQRAEKDDARRREMASYLAYKAAQGHICRWNPGDPICRRCYRGICPECDDIHLRGECKSVR